MPLYFYQDSHVGVFIPTWDELPETLKTEDEE